MAIHFFYTPQTTTHSSVMFSPVTTPNSLRLRPPPPPPFHSSPGSLPSPTSPNIRSPLTSPLSATVYATAETTTCIALSPTMVISPPSLYEILGISMGATDGEIKTAYRRLARISHPDVKDSSGEEFMKIHAAYSTLSDPDKRADYDRRLFRTHRSRSYSSVRSASSYNGFNGYSGRNWETDQCW